MIRCTLRCLSCLVLTLALALAGAAAGAAGVMMAAESGLRQIELCASGTVTLNAAGKPVAPASTRKCADCPACSASLLADAAWPITSIPAPRRILLAKPVQDADLVAGAPVRFAQARAPPKVR